MLLSLGFFLLGVVAAFLFEEYYRQLVRYSLKLFNGKNIQFFGKNSHLFPSYSFVNTFGLFTSFTFLLLRFSCEPNRIKKISLAVLFFFATTFLITAVDSKLMVIGCTACNDGMMRLSFNQPPYDNYFMISLAVAFLYISITYLLAYKRKSNKTQSAPNVQKDYLNQL